MSYSVERGLSFNGEAPFFLAFHINALRQILFTRRFLHLILKLVSVSKLICPWERCRNREKLRKIEKRKKEQQRNNKRQR